MYICIKLEDEYFIPLNVLDIKKDRYSISNYGTIKNSDDDNIVNHLNGIKTENYYLNLEWTTQSSNNIHALNNGLCDNKGEKSHLNKYSDELIHRMCSIMETEKDPYEVCVQLELIKRGTPRSNKEYQKYRSYIKFLRSKTFRKDITKGYNI